MIERLIYTALKEGIAILQANPDFLEDLFVVQYGLSPEEFASIKTLFKAHPPTVCHGYAHADQTFPLMAIILDSETESQAFLGDDAGMVEDPEDPEFGDEVKSAIWEHSYSLLVYAEHPDVTLYYYEIAKSCLLAARDYFINQGLFKLSFSGQDMAPDPRYIPEHLFLRRLTMRCEAEFQRPVPGPQRAFKIRGIAVDSSGSPSDVGGVATKIYPVAVKGPDDGE